MPLKRRILCSYAFFDFFVMYEATSIKLPKMIIKIPERRLTFEFSEMEYISLPLVANPKIVNITPNIANISPIGNLISNPIILFFICYQKIILKMIATIPTTHARKFGF